ncbi:ACT domain-containing protein ACR2 isoform X2 [Prosopis cineraria]|uniref:ACT domain-containing protein ACR2 isoform X2 n=1 Tax=Prosopis cineraria TaxID=364024 RepID=UPI00241005AF|nr:ACT domain-containing protein ACR2 isoform X2 [Prosopis cineraria]XP_054798859.1 ACT domain-containing protein ACR2 isoform X2 [Prosopis cineraria]XP_054798860.1 ACT domain-containing protein ACR2 isoform X2 [Prosopis cineraria]
MKKVCWPYFDPEFDTLPERINGPTCRVTIDNENTEDCTVVKVDSVNKQGLLLEVVQVLTDMNLQICKSYISSDAGWFMDVFHVIDEHGNKLTDQKVINYIQQAIGRSRGSPHSIKAYSSKVFPNYLHPNEHTAIEMTGADHPGLFSEISAALADLHCNIDEAHAWTHNARLACVAYITDQSTHSPIEDPCRLAYIEDRLTTVLRATTNPNSPRGNQQEVKMVELHGREGTMTTVERRLHQLMLSVRDFEAPSGPTTAEMPSGGEEMRRKRMVRIESCKQKGYSIVSIECKDRPRLMFDAVCTLTDMQYVIFHASISAHRGYAFQEYFIRHIDGYALSTESEKERVAKCLEAAIERRVCEGVRVELRAENRVGMLSDITRMLRENGLAVVRADVETHGEKSVNAFYVRDVSGNYEVDIDYFVQSVKREMGPTVLHINHNIRTADDANTTPISFGHKLRSHIDRLSHALLILSAHD